MRYLNFDLRIGARGERGYPLAAESESHGEASAELVIDCGAPDLVALLDRLTARQTDAESLEQLGRDLYRRLFVERVETLFQRSFGATESRRGEGLRVRLRITPAELAALPWELLYSDADSDYVATRLSTPLVRYLDLPQYKRELATPLPLRVLIAIPRGGDPAHAVDAASEQAIIDEALKGLGAGVEATYLHQAHPDRRVTWARLYEHLSERAYHCFHFIGHGTFANDRGHLVLDAEDGGDEFVPDARFAELFTNVPSMKLVVLNACKGATLSSSRPLAGSAAALVAGGVPAVVAMQYSIRDSAAVVFARAFYHSLFRTAERGRVDVAVARGRHRLKVDYPDQRELATPVLFMHTRSGALFVPETGSALRDIPWRTGALDTMNAAAEATRSEPELARFRRRIAIAKRSVRLGLATAAVVFCLFWIRLLDVFTIDTQAEFLTMALGDRIVDHALSDDLRIVTVAAGEGDNRQPVGEAIGLLATAGAEAIALDVNYRSVGGEFAKDPDSGHRLVAQIRAVAAMTPVVVGAKELDQGQPKIPDSLREVVAGVGLVCVETKLGLTRSLPLTLARGDRRIPSLPLAAFAAFHGGRVMQQAPQPEDHALVLFDRRPSVRFAISELNRPRRSSRECPAIKPGDTVAHRFLRLSPPAPSAATTTTAADLRAMTPGEREQRFAGKLVLIGLLGIGDTVRDRFGDRDGVLWQADAISNLLLDEAIVPLGDGAQGVIMLMLAGLAAALRIRFGERLMLGRALLGLITAALIVAVVYTYALDEVLVNPAYHVVALWLAWWLAGRAGRTWLS